jgi:hypothetical protein
MYSGASTSRGGEGYCGADATRTWRDGVEQII